MQGLPDFKKIKPEKPTKKLSKNLAKNNSLLNFPYITGLDNNTVAINNVVQTWIIGKWAGYKEQMWAPSGTHFYQFTLPKIIEFRKDCKYGDSSALKLPDTAKGVNSCEYTMPRRVVHACHAGGVIHALEGYKHHEVGAIDVDRLDTVWDAAMKHGFRPPSRSSKIHF